MVSAANPQSVGNSDITASFCIYPGAALVD